MAPPLYGIAYQFLVTLDDATGNGRFAYDPPLSAGDFLVSLSYGATAPLTTLPTVPLVGTCVVLVSLSASEMLGFPVEVIAHDPDGVWVDAAWQVLPQGAPGSSDGMGSYFLPWLRRRRRP